MAREDQYPKDKLVRPDPSWHHRYAHLAAGLARALGPEWTFEHVGSTSVPDVVAKPVIDIAIRTPDGAAVSETSRLLVRAGWSEVVTVGDHRATFLVVGGVRSSIGHLFTARQWPDAHVRLFAEWLRSHADDRRRYAQLKTSLVHQGTWGPEYTEAKAAFVREVVNRARAARGLPPVAGVL